MKARIGWIVLGLALMALNLGFAYTHALHGEASRAVVSGFAAGLALMGAATMWARP